MNVRRFSPSAVLVVAVATTGVAAYKIRASVHPSVREQLETARVSAQQGRNAEASGYAKAMLMGSSIKVYVDHGDTLPNQVRDTDRAVSAAFAMWEHALDQQVRFDLVDSPKLANVTIEFGRNIKLKGQVVSGFINWSRTIITTAGLVKPNFEADMHLRTTDPSGRPLQYEAMRHTCGHELGHMFGLDDTREIGKLMGPLDLSHPVSKPDASEVETVLAIRAECESLIQKCERGSHAQGFADEHGHGHCHH